MPPLSLKDKTAGALFFGRKIDTRIDVLISLAD
jgi:hypothetical protein